MDQTREQILVVAARLREDGEAPSMNRIAQVAGIGRATLYRRFASAERLWEAVAQEVGGRGVEPRSPQKRIVDAARQLFNQQGFHQTTMQEIAAHARVGLATVYDRYGGKSGILVGVVQSLPLDELEPVIHRGQQAKQDWLHGVVTTMQNIVRQDEGIWSLMSGPSPDIQAAQDALSARLMPHVRAVCAGLELENNSQLVSLKVVLGLSVAVANVTEHAAQIAQWMVLGLPAASNAEHSESGAVVGGR